jgi:hypothetical protein
MNVSRVRAALLVAAVVLAADVAGQAPPASDTAQAAPKASRPWEDVVRLHKAGLSEDFLVRKVGRDGVAYDLSTDDIIACKAAGLPEAVIEAMLRSSKGALPAATPTAAPTATPTAPPTAPPIATPIPIAPAPVVVPPAAPVPPPPTPAPAPQTVAPEKPAPVPPQTPVPVPHAERTWTGLVRRIPGVVLFKYPWEPGTLAYREGRLFWTDTSDPAKNVALGAADLRAQFLVCPKETDLDAACWEWGVKTADSELRVRDASWERGSSPKPSEIRDLVRSAFPGLSEERFHASRKK